MGLVHCVGPNVLELMPVGVTAQIVGQGGASISGVSSPFRSELGISVRRNLERVG